MTQTARSVDGGGIEDYIFAGMLTESELKKRYTPHDKGDSWYDMNFTDLKSINIRN